MVSFHFCSDVTIWGKAGGDNNNNNNNTHICTRQCSIQLNNKLTRTSVYK